MKGSQPPILIWGAGAIGGTLGAYWARAGLPVTMVDIVKEHAEACSTTGLSITGPWRNSGRSCRPSRPIR